jgi:RimJ/RimL family protein N-acetyltransferase
VICQGRELAVSLFFGASRLEAKEPTAVELLEASRDLAAFYNDPHNAALLCNTIRFEPADVAELWGEIAATGGRAMLLFRDGELVGDAAFRRVGERSAELGLLIGPRSLHGAGLGGRFARMLLGLAFGEMSFEHVYVAIRPENAASLRLFARAGFLCDEGPVARACRDSDEEICMVLSASRFAHGRGGALRDLEQAASV